MFVSIVLYEQYEPAKPDPSRIFAIVRSKPPLREFEFFPGHTRGDASQVHWNAVFPVIQVYFEFPEGKDESKEPNSEFGEFRLVAPVRSKPGADETVWRLFSNGRGKTL